MSRSAFIRLVHADWSAAAAGRWAVEAHRTEAGWLVQAPRPVGPMDRFVSELVGGPQPTLAGFDFPIGVPAAFGRQTGFANFSEAFRHFGTGDWARFYDVAEQAAEISLHRPFYPRVSSSSAGQAHLRTALGVADMNKLMRQCERKTGGRKAACSLFWTLGSNQVGKAAIAGWREIVRPALQAGASLWPFDGDLPVLAGKGGLVICETYPAEAYGHVGIRLAGGSKRRQDDRRNATAGLASHCQDHGIRLCPEMEGILAAGFGPAESGQDPFDATAGLLGMIEVADGRRTAAPARTEAPEWEGWILGQAA